MTGVAAQGYVQHSRKTAMRWRWAEGRTARDTCLHPADIVTGRIRRHSARRVRRGVRDRVRRTGRLCLRQPALELRDGVVLALCDRVTTCQCAAADASSAPQQRTSGSVISTGHHRTEVGPASEKSASRTAHQLEQRQRHAASVYPTRNGDVRSSGWGEPRGPGHKHGWPVSGETTPRPSHGQALHRDRNACWIVYIIASGQSTCSRVSRPSTRSRKPACVDRSRSSSACEAVRVRVRVGLGPGLG